MKEKLRLGTAYHCNRILRHVEEEIKSRETAYRRYVERLSEKNGLRLLTLKSGIKPNYAYFPLLVEKELFGKDRDELIADLAKEEIFARKYFYPLVSENKGFERDLTVNTPRALDFSRKILCLPLYAHLASEDVDRICDAVLQEKEKKS